VRSKPAFLFVLVIALHRHCTGILLDEAKAEIKALTTASELVPSGTGQEHLAR